MTHFVGEKLVAAANSLAVLGGALGRRVAGSQISTAVTPDYQKVFVVGCPRSGTTWVADILARHPRVIHGYESQLYPTLAHSIGAYGRNNPRAWARLFYGLERGKRRGAMAGLHHYVDRATLARIGRRVLAESRSDDAAVAGLMRGVLDSYFVREGGDALSVLVEKTPTHVFHIAAILDAFPEAHIVEVRRDGRDACVSMALRSAQVSAFPATHEGRIALWLRAVRAGLAASSNGSAARGRITVVRYEDLKADPAPEILRLFSDVRLEADEDLVREIASASDITRYPTGPGEFRHRGAVGTWTDFFSPADEQQFREMVGDVFVELGYSY